MSKRNFKRHKGKMKKITILIIVNLITLPNIAAAQSFVPHRSAEFTVTEPSGKNTSLSALRGKVVAMNFFFLQSNHCMRVARMLNQLNLELGPRGFQALGVVFDPPNVPESHGEFVGPVVTAFKLTYPIGYSSKADVDSYLGRQRNEVLNIPQIVVIDRAGMIRAASGVAGGDPRLEDEARLRGLIEELLSEAHH